MKMQTYRFKLKHDNGSVIIRVIARNKEVAKNMIMLAENCPERAMKLLK